MNPFHYPAHSISGSGQPDRPWDWNSLEQWTSCSCALQAAMWRRLERDVGFNREATVTAIWIMDEWRRVCSKVKISLCSGPLALWSPLKSQSVQVDKVKRRGGLCGLVFEESNKAGTAVKDACLPYICTASQHCWAESRSFWQKPKCKYLPRRNCQASVCLRARRAGLDKWPWMVVRLGEVGQRGTNHPVRKVHFSHDVTPPGCWLCGDLP